VWQRKVALEPVRLPSTGPPSASLVAAPHRTFRFVSCVPADESGEFHGLGKSLGAARLCGTIRFDLEAEAAHREILGFRFGSKPVRSWVAWIN